MGCSANGRQRLYAGQGLDSIDTMADVSDEVISNMCKILRRDEAVPVSAMAEDSLKLGCFVARHYRRISRNLTPNGLTRNLINNYRDLKAEEDAYETPDNNVEIDRKDWAKTMDAMKDYLSIRLGRTKIPLAYIIRNNVDVPAAAGDPQDNYDTHQDEMIARAPHQDAAGDPLDVYNYDNRQVWDLISGWTRDTECWVHVKPFQRRRNGREAYLALYNHYLGINTVNNQARTAESKLDKLEYKSEQRRWGLEKYMQAFKKQYEILKNLEDMEGSTYSAPDEGTMVRKFIDGVKSNSFDACKAQVMAQPEMGRDLERVFGLYKDFLSQTKAAHNPTLTVSRVEANQGKRGGDEQHEEDIPEHVWMKADVEDVYYPTDEYKELSEAQRIKLKWLRDNRGPSVTKKPKKDGNKKSKRDGSKKSKTNSHEKSKTDDDETNDDQIHALATQLKSMTEALSAVSKVVNEMRKKRHSDDSSSSEDEN